MSMKFKKTFNDLKNNFSRTLLVVFALVIGIWGAGSIFVSYTILQNDLSENYLRTSPPHVIITSNDFSNLSLTEFRSRPEIESAEFRGESFQRIKVGPDSWLPLWLFGVEDFSTFNLARIYNEEGNKIAKEGTILIERNGQLVSDLKIGSLANIRAGNKSLEIPISGICFDPAQAPATQDAIIYAYADKKTFEAISGETINHRLILRLKNVKSKHDVQLATNKIIDDFKSSEIKVSSINIPKLNEHPHQWQLNTLLFLEGSIGLLAFLMAAVLVSQLMASLLAKQIRQIGVLKAIGATRFNIFQIYGAMVLIFGIIAGAIAIPLAVVSGYAYAGFVAKILNFEILTTGLPNYIYFCLISVSLILPLIFSLPSLLKGITISVQDAISDYGIKQNASNEKVGFISRFPLPHNLILAVRNTMRQKKRLFITVVTMSLGVAIFSTGFNVRSSLAALLSDVKNGMRYDVQVVLNDQVPKEEALLAFKNISNVKKIETWNGGKGELQSKVISNSDGVGIIALPYNTDLLKHKIIDGRWLSNSTEPEIVMNQKALENYNDLTVGKFKTLNVGEKSLKVKLVGVVEEFDRPKIYIDIKQYDAFANPNHLINSVMFIAKNNDYDKVISLKKDIEKAITPSNLSVFYVMSQAERVKIIYDHLNIILTTIVFFALLVLMVSALGMASATSINIMERTREIGVLRAIGGTPKQIYNLFIYEGMIVSIASIFLGLLLAWPLSIAASTFFGNLMLGEGISLKLTFNYNGFWITLITTIVFGWLASRIPARKAINVSTKEALAYE